jgi:hypothetical protein
MRRLMSVWDPPHNRPPSYRRGTLLCGGFPCIAVACSCRACRTPFLSSSSGYLRVFRTMTSSCTGTKSSSALYSKHRLMFRARLPGPWQGMRTGIAVARPLTIWHRHDRRRQTHDIQGCPYTHPGEASARRDPTVHKYSSVTCPDAKLVRVRSSRCCSLPHQNLANLSYAAAGTGVPPRAHLQVCTPHV